MSDDSAWAWITPGLPFGRVTVTERLGSGGMSVVFRGNYRDLGVDVAIKILHPDLPRERFHREASIGMRLRDHPHIAKTLHIDEAHGHPYLIIELLAYTWQQFAEHRQEPRNPLGANWFLDAARGLAEIHAAGIVHRDIKPSNIMVCPRGTSKITDLGLARSLLEPPRLESGHYGTPQYAAPEQAAGEAIDARADVYSLGMCYWQMLTGCPMDSWQRKFLADTEPPLLASTSRRLAPLLRAMTELEPSRRPADGSAVVAELLALERPPRSPRRFATFALVAMSGVGIGAIAMPRTSPPPEEWQTPYRSLFIVGKGLSARLSADLAEAAQSIGIKLVERPLAPMLGEIRLGDEGFASAKSLVRRGNLIAGQVFVMVQGAASDQQHVQLRTAVVETGEMVDSRFVALADVRIAAEAMLRSTLQRLEERGRILACAPDGSLQVSLGSWHGLQPGDRLQILDAHNHACAQGTVLRAHTETARLRLDDSATAAVGMRVERVPVDGEGAP